MSDLISREKALEIIKANHYPLRAEHNTIDYGMFTVGIEQAINEAPAVDAVEVVHAHWTRVDDWTDECSVCGDWHENDVNDRTPYCANCGAKMDGHKKDVM